MAIQQETLWITRSDLAPFREISPNIEDSDVDRFIREAQTGEIAGFVGPEMYAAMVADFNTTFQDANYLELWEGGTYTNKAGDSITFHGLATAHIYFAYARFLLQHPVNVNRFGVSTLADENSERSANSQVRGKAREAQQQAIKYQAECKIYLEDQLSSFPLYAKSYSQNPKTSAFPFFKA